MPGSEKHGFPCSIVHSLGALEKNTPLFAFVSSSAKTTRASSGEGDIHKSSTNFLLSMCNLTWCDTNDLTVRPGYGAEKVK